MLTPSFVSHKRELNSSIPQVCVDALPIRKVKCDGSEHLFQTEGRERFDDAFRRLAPQERIYDGVKGNPAPGNVISAFALFDISSRHTALSVQCRACRGPPAKGLSARQLTLHGSVDGVYQE